MDARFRGHDDGGLWLIGAKTERGRISPFRDRRIGGAPCIFPAFAGTRPRAHGPAARRRSCYGARPPMTARAAAFAAKVPVFSGKRPALAGAKRPIVKSADAHPAEVPGRRGRTCRHLPKKKKETILMIIRFLPAKRTEEQPSA